MEPIEQLDGVGDVFEGKSETPSARVTYHLTVWQEWTEISRGRRLPGPIDTTGRLDIEPLQADAWMRKGTPITVHLADGRWIDLIVTNSSGDVTAAGAIRETR
jgi:hypothetical protein